MKHILFVALMLSVLMNLTACGFEQVDEGFRGIKTVWGKVDGDPLKPELYFYNPISSTIFEMDVREHLWKGDTNCYTKDNQQVDISYAVTAFPIPEKIGEIYSQFGRNWEDKIIPQQVLEGLVKDVIGGLDAQQLVGSREAAHVKAYEKLKAELVLRNINVTTLSFANLKFKKEFEDAAEAKVIATQKAEEAKNKTREVEEKALQIEKMAVAEANAMKIKSAALSQNKSLIGYEIALKWDGHLPQIMLGGGSMPMLDLSKLKDYSAKAE